MPARANLDSPRPLEYHRGVELVRRGTKDQGMRRRQAVPRKTRSEAVPVRSVVAFGAIMLGALLVVAASVLVALALFAALRPDLLPNILP